MWTLQDAKARFSAVVEAALAGEPQAVTRRGKPAVMIVGAEDWARLTRAAGAAGFGSHLAAVPRGPAEDPFPRAPLTARGLDL